MSEVVDGVAAVGLVPRNVDRVGFVVDDEDGEADGAVGEGKGGWPAGSGSTIGADELNLLTGVAQAQPSAPGDGGANTALAIEGCRRPKVRRNRLSIFQEAGAKRKPC